MSDPKVAEDLRLTAERHEAEANEIEFGPSNRTFPRKTD